MTPATARRDPYRAPLPPATAAPPASPSEAAALARRVDQVLRGTDAFRTMPAAQQAEIARNLTKLTSYLADPVPGQRGGGGGGPARALADVRSSSSRRTVQQGSGFGDASRAGSDALAANIQAVNFPKFVSSLIDGVFNSIVNSSIKQMHEYGKFLEAVAKTVDQFATDHITMPQAKQYVANKFPQTFGIEQDADGNPQLKVKDADSKPDFKSQLGMDGDVDLDDEENIEKVAIAAQMQMARQRQQQLAAMVMLGINRIVVTDGKINAKVVFDVKSTDKNVGTRTSGRNTSSTYNYDQQTSRESGGWGSDDFEQDTHETYVSTTNTNDAATRNNEKTLEAKTKLTGEVSINFKSDYFPLERLTSAADLTRIESNAKPPERAPA